MGSHGAVILNGAQHVKIAWGPGERRTEPDVNREEVLKREYLLCHDCQRSLLQLVGAFFFSEDALTKSARVAAQRELKEAEKRCEEAKQRLVALKTEKEPYAEHGQV